nr:MAG TPA: Protein of unknown function (DUF2835) [Caudoviricetes sp.]
MQKLVIVRAERGRKLVLPEESLTPRSATANLESENH